MKKWLLSCVIVFYLTAMHAQIGFTVSPTSTFAPNWQVLVENYATHEHIEFLKYGATGVLDYTFTLSNPAWRIQPAIHAMRTSIDYVPHHFDIYSLGIQGNISVAPFLKDQSEKNDRKPVMFLQLSPGLGYVHARYKVPVLEGGTFSGMFDEFEGEDFVFNVGVQVFLEWKLTPFLSVSPVAGIRYYPTVEWKGFTSYLSNGDPIRSFDNTWWRQLNFGLRMGLNIWNKK